MDVKSLVTYDDYERAGDLYMLDAAIYNEHFDVIRVIIKKPTITYADLDKREVLFLAIAKEDIDIVITVVNMPGFKSYCLHNGYNTRLNELFDTGNLEIIELMLSKDTFDDSDLEKSNYYIIKNAALKGHLHIMQWIMDRPEYKGNQYDSLHDGILQNAAKGGQVHIIEWFMNKYPIEDVDYKELLVEAIRDSRLNVVKYLINRFKLVTMNCVTPPMPMKMMNRVAVTMIFCILRLSILNWMS